MAPPHRASAAAAMGAVGVERDEFHALWLMIVVLHERDHRQHVVGSLGQQRRL